MEETLTREKKKKLIELADTMLTVAPSGPRHYVLAARFDPKWNGYKPYLTNWGAFDKDEKVLLLQAHFEPRIRSVKPTDPHDNELEEDIVTGSIDLKSGRKRIVVDYETRNKRVTAAPYKKWIDWSKLPNHVWPKPDEVPDWSKKTEKQIEKDLETQGLFVPDHRATKPIFFDFEEGVIPQIKSAWVKILEHHQVELNLKYPDSKLDKKLNQALSAQLRFDRLIPDNPTQKYMALAPRHLKESLIRDLYFSGALDEFPFKVRAVAFLIGKGFKNSQEALEIFELECLGLKNKLLTKPDVPALTVQDFAVYQSVLESLIAKLVQVDFMDRKDLHRIASQSLKIPMEMAPFVIQNIWKRVMEIIKSLSPKQLEVLNFLYKENKTYSETAQHLRISPDSVRDREESVVQKFKKEFPEFKSLRLYKDFTKNQYRFYIQGGYAYAPLVGLVHPIYRIKTVNGKELREKIWPLFEDDHFKISKKNWLAELRKKIGSEKEKDSEVDAG